MTPTLEAFLARHARSMTEAVNSLEKARGTIWAQRAHSGGLISGATLKLHAQAVGEAVRNYAAQSAPDIYKLHTAHQSAAWDAVITAAVQIKLGAMSSPQLEIFDDRPSAIQAFRRLVEEETGPTIGRLKDAAAGFDLKL